MEESRLKFKFVSSLNIRCEKVRMPRGLLFLRSLNWLRFKNVKINPHTMMIHSSKSISTYPISQRNKKNHCEGVKNTSSNQSGFSLH